MAFESLSVAAALPELGAELGQVRLLPWVMTGYLLASGLALACSGPILDALGPRIVFRLAVPLFAGSSVLCGVAQSLELLIAARVIQGLSGGALVGVNGSAIGLGFPPELRSRAYALASTVWGVLAFGGPALAALLLAVADWRWIFLVNAPLALFALVLGWGGMPDRADDAESLSIDVRGIVLVAVLTSAALLAVSDVSATAILGFAVALLAGTLYWRHSGRAERPLIRRRHFARYPFAALGLTAGLSIAAGVGVDTYLPLYLRGARGASTTVAAWAVIYLTIGWTLAANIVSRLYHRFPEGRFALLGPLLLLPSLALSGVGVALDAPLPWLYAAFFVVGFAIGTSTNACITLVQLNASETEMGRATSVHQFLRNMAMTYGTAAAGAALLLVAVQVSGDPEAVRELIGGAQGASSADQEGAIRQGFVAAHGVGLAITLVSIWIGRTLFEEGSLRPESSD